MQGVGFRPFVYRLATELALCGGVKNTSQGVVIDLEGDPEVIAQFLYRLRQSLPAHADIQSIEQKEIPAAGSTTFEIWPSTTDATAAGGQILPDLAICPECLQDIFNPGNRRYGYAFTSCTHCGPRYSIIEALPYDRAQTTMRAFEMCPECLAEYATPTQRRFHAQPNACDRCGPSLSFWADGIEHKQAPLQKAIASLKQGKIVAIKGLGGFQLLVDARNNEAITRLRQLKQRPHKPLALICATFAAARRHAQISEVAAALLTAAPGPIVLLPRRQDVSELSRLIAPQSPFLGIMLPTTPLHYLLLGAYGHPVVATSGNVSGEPICTDNRAALEKLSVIADAFLVHNRPIQRPVDDSVVQIVQDRPQILRHARGYAPQTIHVANQLPASTCVLAVGAHLKSAIALSIGEEIMLSQHIGDLNNAEARNQLKQTADDFLSLHQARPDAIACDQHPDYGSTQLAQALAKKWKVPLIPVQHHYAHILACMAEHQLQAPVLGVAWDGTGYGTDGTIWGGEFLQVTDHGFERMAHCLPYDLPGAEQCSLEPRRSALGLLYACYGAAAFEMTDLAPMQSFTRPQLVILRKMLTQKVNTPATSSIGRMFDGVASLLNLHHYISFEGQAARTVEFAASQSSVRGVYPFVLYDTQPVLIDWRPMLKAMVRDIQDAVMTPVIAAKFHNTLTKMIVDVSRQMGIQQVVLAGGCFQNKVLIERTIRQLSSAGFTPYWSQKVPTNDGGLAVGQVKAAWRQLPHARR
ncbi:(NiFe) hydrogenase maturation protein HypF [Synechococcus sp. PCC 7335]|nr:(NiFe) hydrogenase maturation protein HypF [Synechococcus sp. PCC 7335]